MSDEVYKVLEQREDENRSTLGMAGPILPIQSVPPPVWQTSCLLMIYI
jgi:hypothetical protein